MARRLFIFDDPDRFVAGTIGEPGARTFFLQARQGKAVVSVAIEKVQVAALAERINDLLAALSGMPVSLPEEPPRDDAPLDEPLIDAFRVGPMALGWDAAAEQVVVEAQPQTESGDYLEVPDDAAEGPDIVRVRIGAERAREFVRRAEALVSAGRPTCPFCGEPLEPTGHFCARTNAHLN